MRYVISVLSCTLMAAFAAPVYGDDAAEACSTLPAESLSKTMLAGYPDSWKKQENEKFALSFLYPPMLHQDDKANKDALSFNANWCGDSSKNSEPLTMEVRVFSTRAVRNQHERMVQTQPALDYLSQKIYPNIAASRTVSEDVHCATKTLRRDTTTSKNGDFNYLRQSIDVEHGAKNFEFAFSYSTSLKVGDKAKTDEFIKDNNALECDIVSSLAFTEPVSK